MTLESHRHAGFIKKISVAAVAFLLHGGGVQAQEISFDKLQKVDAIYSALPDNIKKAGKIVAATEADYAPFEFLDSENKLIGADIDLSKALGLIMGVPVENQQTPFSAIMPGLQAKRFDVGISSVGDYVAREVTMDFVDYYRGGTSFLTPATATEPKALEDICGTKVGVLAGTASEKQAKEASTKCTGMGKPEITVNTYPNQNDAILALMSGRIDSVSGDSASNGYAAKQVGPKIKNVGRQVYGDQPYYGIAIPKGSPLYQPFFDAMGELMKSGVYTEIMTKWGLADGAIPKPLKNQVQPG
ncbi:ABC transporter substrate-binding protein [Mesorhizobium sp. ESP7-2]|uniref:ABC transporter substrate-binding protein n=1 Tax=Mesorhizobium sp. ESP7-2 TaxID=2876622 RepID=UPI001CCB211D|nr:ABC transporter substrate-binding protein [Mesorhizobium sp. ESP7-2]MBZ9709496.1 ABC transporter substrate-binding protein [Mesorhizobium sp. ESP7-2]